MSLRAHSTILVIEDDDSVRSTLLEMLELNGFRTTGASNGTDGLAAALDAPPSLIITDLGMPGMTGFELLRSFHADPVLRTVPVIVISAMIDRATTRRGMEMGAADFITKPFTEEEVIHSVNARLEHHELLEELDAFAHTVAHDLKNPLCTINGRLELLDLMLGKSDPETLRRQLAETRVAARRLNEIIDELLILSGVRRQPITSLPLDMAAIVAESIDRLADLIGKNSACIHRPATWPAAVGHAPWVVEIWVNYIGNAVKYGGPDPQIALGAETGDNGWTTRFWVEDRGPGIDEEARPKLFVPFTRISTARAKGHGLGLSIVRRIAEKLGGQVGVISAPGAGSRFWFQLPSDTSRPPSA